VYNVSDSRMLGLGTYASKKTPIGWLGCSQAAKGTDRCTVQVGGAPFIATKHHVLSRDVERPEGIGVG
jgi:hypothetical protein